MNKHLILILLGFGLVGCATYEPIIIGDDEAYYTSNSSVFESVPAPRAQITNLGATGYSAKRFYLCSGNNIDKIIQFCLVQCAKDVGEYKAKSHCRVYKVSEKEGQSNLMDKVLAYNNALNKIEPDIYTKMQNSKRLAEEAKAKQEEERRRQIAQAQQAQYENYINNKKSICMSYGFTEDNAIATCVQREITNERNLLAAQQAQANAQAQADYQRRMNALSNYGRCLGTQGETFSSCANAWQGYTPPTKTVTKCQYDVFGNVITSTCKTQ